VKVDQTPTQCSTHSRDPWTFSNSALPLHYILTGVVQNITMGVMYGVLLGTMSTPGHVYVTARTLVAAPWATKVVFGLLSDCIPIMGRYRRHYCSIGWAIVATAHFILTVAFHEPERPFYCIDTGFGDLGNYIPAAGICNHDAAKDSWKFTLLLTVSTLGLTIAESAADGLTLECAKSWDDQKDRGRVMTMSLLLRMSGGIFGSAFLAFCFNGRRHMGWFSWELSLQAINASVTILSVSIALIWQIASSADLPVAHVNNAQWCFKGCHGPQWCFKGRYTMLQPRAAHDHSTASHAQCCGRLMKKVRDLSRKMCTYRLAMFVAFNFIAPILTWMTAPSHSMMMRYWANVQQMQSQLTDICVFGVFSFGILCFQRYILACRWSVLVVSATVVGCIFSVFIEIITAMDLAGRNQYFYQASELFLQLPRACNYLVCIVILAELAPRGFEASVYGIISSAHSLAPLIARAVSNPLYAYLPVLISRFALPASKALPPGALSNFEYYVSDTTTFRLTVAVSVGVSSIAAFSSLAFIGLLPSPGWMSRDGSFIPSRALSSGIVPRGHACRTQVLFVTISVLGVISTGVAIAFSVTAILP
jgi:hypothetical protein